MELSSHALCQHRGRGRGPGRRDFHQPDPDHLDYHRDLEGYFAAKARLHGGSCPAPASGGSPPRR